MSNLRDNDWIILGDIEKNLGISGYTVSIKTGTDDAKLRVDNKLVAFQDDFEVLSGAITNVDFKVEQVSSSLRNTDSLVGTISGKVRDLENVVYNVSGALTKEINDRVTEGEILSGALTREAEQRLREDAVLSGIILQEILERRKLINETSEGIIIGDYSGDVKIAGKKITFSPNDGTNRVFVGSEALAYYSEVSGAVTSINQEISDRRFLIYADFNRDVVGGYSRDLAISGRTINLFSAQNGNRATMGPLGDIAVTNDIESLYPIGAVYTTTAAEVPSSLPGEWISLGTIITLGGYQIKAWRRI